VSRSALTYPATVTGAITIAIFAGAGSLLVWGERFAVHGPAQYIFAVHALMLPAWLAIFGQLSCYGAFVMRAIARGHDEPAPPPIGALNPFASIAIPLMIGAVAATAWCADAAINDAGGSATVLALASIAITPAFVAAVALDDNAASSLDPRRIVEMIAHSGIAYAPLAIAIAVGYGCVFAAIWYGAGAAVPVVLAASAYLFLTTQALAGTILFARRNELRFDTDFSPEQDVAHAVAENERELEALLTELHRLAAVDRNRHAYARLDEYLARDRYRNDARVHEALRQFQGRTLRLEHAVHYIERLVAARDTRTAWTVCKRALDEDDQFRPLGDASVIALVAQATETDARYAATLLGDFARAYPDSALHANALFRLAQLKIDRLADAGAGIELLDRVEHDYPRFAGLAAFRDYALRVRAAQKEDPT
jgi:hypothetical protein